MGPLDEAIQVGSRTRREVPLASAGSNASGREKPARQKSGMVSRERKYSDESQMRSCSSIDKTVENGDNFALECCSVYSPVWSFRSGTTGAGRRGWMLLSLAGGASR
jgi:hypothetical protein